MLACCSLKLSSACPSQGMGSAEREKDRAVPYQCRAGPRRPARARRSRGRPDQGAVICWAGGAEPCGRGRGSPVPRWPSHLCLHPLSLGRYGTSLCVGRPRWERQDGESFIVFALLSRDLRAEPHLFQVTQRGSWWEPPGSAEGLCLPGDSCQHLANSHPIVWQREVRMSSQLPFLPPPPPRPGMWWQPFKVRRVAG